MKTSCNDFDKNIGDAFQVEMAEDGGVWRLAEISWEFRVIPRKPSCAELVEHCAHCPNLRAFISRMALSVRAHFPEFRTHSRTRSDGTTGVGTSALRSVAGEPKVDELDGVVVIQEQVR